MSDAHDPKDGTPKAQPVGYKNPPEHTRFRAGQSGNPAGRPRGRRNLKTDLQAELSQRITVREGDRRVSMTKQQALVKSTVAQAINGNPRAQAKAYELLLRAFGIEDEIHDQSKVGEDDEAILAAYIARQQRNKS